MKKKEIEICGKKVCLGYCYATEIAFMKYTGKDLSEFDGKNAEDVMYVILSSILSVSEYEKKEAAVTVEDLMYTASPGELTEALKVVMELRVAWYRVPVKEEEEKAEDSSKN